MLTHIHIKNFVIVEELELEFNSGMTVMTGETGAGKSIIIDAVELALGNRADHNIIREGEERCDISLCVKIKNLKSVQDWLKIRDLQQDDECIIRRSINREGRSRAYINGHTSPLSQLRELGSLLINIHGQHEYQALLKRDKQRQLLDNFAGHHDLRAEVNELYQNWHNTNKQLDQILGNDTEQNHRKDLLVYQLTELEQLAISEHEFTDLEKEHKQLSNAQQVLENCQLSLDLLSENTANNAEQILHQAQQSITNFVDLSTELGTAYELINNALIQSQEASHELRNYLTNLSLDPERLNWLNHRMQSIHDIARKHRVKPEKLYTCQRQLQQELSDLTDVDEKIQTLTHELNKLADDYQKLATKLSKKRQQAAKKLCQAVSKSMQKLGMPGGKFDIKFEYSKHSKPMLNGIDRIEFVVSANPGQPLQALNKVASGGELSRISLAIQAITAQKDDPPPTLVFDEVDVGIGGSIAEIVGQLLKQLSHRAQVLCVTHLPQVAAQGNQHLLVEKQRKAKQTQSKISVLDKQQRIQEIARMLGGVKITKQTLAHAEEMCS